MVTHIVFFKLKVPVPDIMNTAATTLRGLEGRIDVLRSLEVGTDIMHNERSFDVALTATFDSVEDLNTYKNDPAHVKVAEYMKEVSARVISVDYNS